MTSASSHQRGFTIVRKLDAPREVVFQAWTDPDHLDWFATTAPRSHPTTVDLRVGGAWRLQMVESDERSYLTGGIYREIVPPERISFVWGVADGWPPLDPDRNEGNPVVTVTLKDLGPVTEMTVHVGFPDSLSEEKIHEWLALGVVDGWSQTVDRLEPYLDGQADAATGPVDLLTPSGRLRPAARPQIVTAADWRRARDELLLAEKEATRALDALAAHRRRLPMVSFDHRYAFDTPEGAKSLLELFDGRAQLAVYQFMDKGPDSYCGGCTWFTANIPETAPAYLANNGVTWVTVSDMPLAQIEAYKARMGWTIPFVSSHGTSFSKDCGVGEGFMLSVFLRDGDQIYRTYATTARGVDRILFVNNILDLLPYGRQEEWEDSPVGWPQYPTYG